MPPCPLGEVYCENRSFGSRMPTSAYDADRLNLQAWPMIVEDY